ncbi:MAG: cation diffusion facilitator family transporter [Acidimicrobiales bacterium]
MSTASERADDGEESLGTVLVALVTNLTIAAIKILAGLLGASSALLSEGAHSIADSGNQALLIIAIKRGDRPADRDHPFGHGKEHFFYSLLAGVCIFVAGGTFSIVDGVVSLLHPETHSGSYTIKYGVLAGSVILEAVSWLRAARQLKRQARIKGRSLLQHVNRTTDPTVKTVAIEDSAALVGLGLAAVGIGLHQATGNAFYDAAASLAIGVLLMVVAVVLIHDSKGFLVGQAAEPAVRDGVRSMLEAYPEVTSVVELMTQIMGPHELLVAARVDIDDNLTGRQIEDVSTRIEGDLHHAYADVTQVFLDATRATVRWRPPGGSPKANRP